MHHFHAKYHISQSLISIFTLDREIRPQGLIYVSKCGNTIGIGYYEICSAQALPIKTPPCWSNSSPGHKVGPEQIQMNLQIQVNQIQTKSPGVFILNLTVHYYCAKYNINFIPK